MWQYIIPAVATVAVAIIEALAARDRKQAKEDRAAAEQRAAEEKAHREAKEQAREQLLLILVESTGAAIALGEATGHAMQRGHTNGDMEAALEYAATVKHKQKEFLSKQGIHAMWD
jgi:hypothetical protein